MADLIFHGQFIDADNLDGETGLTVTIDVYRTTISDGSTSQVVTDGSCTETGGGIYRYRYASADLSLYHYVANMKTASTDVSQKHVACLGLVVPDALVSSRLAPTDAGRTLDIAATGEASANVANLTEVAEAILLADWEAITGIVPDRSTLNALRFLRNKWTAADDALTVYEEDDTTPAWTAALSSNAAANPVTGSAPVGSVPA